jgi:hypothetical protein
MNGRKQEWAPLRPNVLRNTGIALFVISFFFPSRWRTNESFQFFGGVQAFIYTPVTACEFVMDNNGNDTGNTIWLFFLMMGPWLCNLTIFTRMPRVVALIAVLLPWVSYVFLFDILAGFLPFYPWALGIALIHLSRWQKPIYQHGNPVSLRGT